MWGDGRNDYHDINDNLNKNEGKHTLTNVVGSIVEVSYDRRLSSTKKKYENLLKNRLDMNVLKKNNIQAEAVNVLKKGYEKGDINIETIIELNKEYLILGELRAIATNYWHNKKFMKNSLEEGLITQGKIDSANNISKLNSVMSALYDVYESNYERNGKLKKEIKKTLEGGLKGKIITNEEINVFKKLGQKNKYSEYLTNYCNSEILGEAISGHCPKNTKNIKSKFNITITKKDLKVLENIEKKKSLIRGLAERYDVINSNFESITEKETKELFKGVKQGLYSIDVLNDALNVEKRLENLREKYTVR